jgi:quercetin 2,3-dioxygenase
MDGLKNIKDSEIKFARQVGMVTTAPSGFEGEGFPVRRAFAGVPHQLLDPFIHMDQMGEIEYGPYEPRGTNWHPHRGFETVTYMLEGQMQHQDSHGGGGLIGPGDTQWMTAGSGILHIETPPEKLVVSGGVFHGIQLWVNLPSSAKMLRPKYQNITKNKVEKVLSPDGGAELKIIAGTVDGVTGPGETHSPITLVHARISPGHEIVVPWNPQYNALVYVLDGMGDAGPDSPIVTNGQLMVLGPGDMIHLRAKMHFDVMLLGGLPIREPISKWGPFVMNTKSEIEQALDDYRKGKLGVIPQNGLFPYRKKS